MPPTPILEAIGNLATYHRAHEQHYAAAPLHDALELEAVSRTLRALAERWSVVQPVAQPSHVPFSGAPDLNDPRAIETSGVLFMEGPQAPAEIGVLRRRVAEIADGHERAGEWLASAMETAWDAAVGLLDEPGFADLLGERHHIIANDWTSATLARLVGRHLHRALAVLDRIDFAPQAVRADLAGPRTTVRYLYAASELIDRAADLATTSATLVHDNERRWRLVRDRAAELTQRATTTEA